MNKVATELHGSLQNKYGLPRMWQQSAVVQN